MGGRGGRPKGKVVLSFLCMDLQCLIRPYGFMTAICPYMGIPEYGLKHVHILAFSDISLILMTSGISIYGLKGTSSSLVLISL